MARKKNQPAKKKTKSRRAKKAKVAPKARAAKSSKAKVKATKAVKTAKSVSTKRGATSVDSLLKRFDKDRSQKETQLGVMQKKRIELQDKSKKLQEQIAKASQQISETESQISKLDSQRDQEVKELLSKLGVKIDSPQSASKPAAAAGQQSPKNSGDRGRVNRETLTFANGRDD